MSLVCTIRGLVQEASIIFGYFPYTCSVIKDVFECLSWSGRSVLNRWIITQAVNVEGIVNEYGGMAMDSNSHKPLTPALSRLMETCINLKTTNSKTLAAHLNRSPATIRTEFQRILQIMNVHCRYSAVKAAEDENWIRITKNNENK